MYKYLGKLKESHNKEGDCMRECEKCDMCQKETRDFSDCWESCDACNRCYAQNSKPIIEPPYYLLSHPWLSNHLSSWFYLS